MLRIRERQQKITENIERQKQQQQQQNANVQAASNVVEEKNNVEEPLEYDEEKNIIEDPDSSEIPCPQPIQEAQNNISQQSQVQPPNVDLVEDKNNDDQNDEAEEDEILNLLVENFILAEDNQNNESVLDFQVSNF